MTARGWGLAPEPAPSGLGESSDKELPRECCGVSVCGSAGSLSQAPAYGRPRCAAVCRAAGDEPRPSWCRRVGTRRADASRGERGSRERIEATPSSEGRTAVAPAPLPSVLLSWLLHGKWCLCGIHSRSLYLSDTVQEFSRLRDVCLVCFCEPCVCVRWAVGLLLFMGALHILRTL